MTLLSESHRIVISLPIVRTARLALLAARNDSAVRRPTLVEPGIWVGGIPSRRCWHELCRAGVTAAVCLLREGPPPRWTTSVEQLLWLPVADRHAPTPEQFAAGWGFLDMTREQGRTILIFCGAGMGRAPTLYCAWRARRAGESLDAAIGRMCAARPVVSLTRRQLAALRSWSASPPRAVGKGSDRP